MAKFPKLSSNRFGLPPQPEETIGNLSAPEVAPADPIIHSKDKPKKSRTKTGRTVLFSTRVTDRFYAEFRDIAQRDNLLLTRLLELSLDAYKREKQK